ncbi:MAG: serine/threonine-protein phosphatase [Ectothiorhodospiraceae bacterium]|nr:serine/threonine-protein phosphatase [Ectothiorhodospiraceae bacterium]
MTDTTIRRPVQWYSAAQTDVGMVRKVNEDAIFSKPEINLWAVADGMGGHEAGNVASSMIVDALDQIDARMHLDSFTRVIEDTLHDVNARLLEYSEIMLDGRIVGSTVAILLIRGQVGVCMWAGDSRLYRCRDNTLVQLSDDHSHVTELVKQGSISPEEAHNHPDANVITRAVGTSEHLFVDIDVFDVKAGDTYMLCTDGLYNAVDDENIAHCLHEEVVDTAVSRLINVSLDNNAADNVSVVVVRGSRNNDDH